MSASFDPFSGNDADAGAGAPSGGGTGGGNDFTGLPCDVAMLLATYCVSCHGATPAAGAPMSLVTRDDLASTSSQAGKSFAALSIERMRDTSAPMPPAGELVAERDIQAFEAWVQGGLPEGSCGAVSDPFDTPVICTSDSYWTRGNDESERMRPGHACIDCHTRGVPEDDGELERGPRFAFAGTVFASAHEPNDCNGVDGEDGDAVVIEVTDAAQRVFRTTANDVGNFYYEDRITYPILGARVIYQGRERVMGTEVPTGDCNACHTESGTEGAPGRIMLP